jgi:hypothetical protein
VTPHPLDPLPSLIPLLSLSSSLQAAVVRETGGVGVLKVERDYPVPKGGKPADGQVCNLV